jgi:NTE family protein
MRAIGAAATSAADLQRAMGAFALESDATLGPAAAEHWRATVAARLPRQQWPDRPMIVAAVNAHTGELVAFDRDSGVDLVDAVMAGTALPGVVPTHNINGTHYINGGVRSAENADLAMGYAHVVVISPFGGRTGPPPAGQFEGLRRFPGADLESQVEALRQQGSRVEVIAPDADSSAAMGTNQMDPATRIPAAPRQAGSHQRVPETVGLPPEPRPQGVDLRRPVGLHEMAGHPKQPFLDDPNR